MATIDDDDKVKAQIYQEIDVCDDYEGSSKAKPSRWEVAGKKKDSGFPDQTAIDISERDHRQINQHLNASIY